ncbi:MAG: pimeloyl-ACP methyl ester carboxylesterase [Marivirga sp.]|jgi:pimeloyl-ACP methyl ester carboxylesterase
MKAIYTLLTIILIGSTASIAQDFTGKWNGILEVQGTQVPLVFKIEKTEDGYNGTFDSPKQGAKDIPFSSVTIKDNSIKLYATNIGAFYEGNWVSDSIVGSWNQGGMSIPLNIFRKERQESKANRPQEPKGKLPYEALNVQFTNPKAEIKLAGTLTLPSNSASQHPVVILISGSGAQNRNEEIFGHRPFLVLADYLTRKGIAVLRYDDRGTAESEGDFAASTTADFATDVLSAVAYLKTREDIDHNQIGLIGHSEGGIIAPMVANQTQDVSFLVILAGTGISGKALSLMQSASLAPAALKNKEAYYNFNKKLLDIASSEADVAIKRDKLSSHFVESREIIEELLPAGTDIDRFIEQQLNSTLSPWSQFFFSYNPADEFEKVTIPVLSLNGSKDAQVEALTNQSAIKIALEKAGNKHFVVKELAGLNHMFQEAPTGAISEYGQIEQSFSPLALNEISEWILDTVK